jgi:hypothetical protein
VTLTARTLIAIALSAAAIAVGVGAVLLSRGGDGTGIRGRVTGGCVTGECAEQPTPKVGLQRVVRAARPHEASDNGTELVTTFRSAEDGTFRLSLPPGRYRIDEDPRSPAPGFMKSVVVDVRKGHFTKVYLFYDIGMR